MIGPSKERYYPPKRFLNDYTQLETGVELEVIGRSVQNRPIYAITIGNGPQKVMAWSQMHGNESTTTHALIELLKSFQASPEKTVLDKVTLRIIFQLNPDGSHLYTRENASQIDLNRDASLQTQPEMKVLISEYTSFQPRYCLNLHGQRTIFSAGTTTRPASLSFLAPAVDESLRINEVRIKAMQLIAGIVDAHPQSNAWGIGRYDDAFNINCTGDYFMAQGTPTILFEAGHYPNDYDRIKTRPLVLKSLLQCLELIGNQSYDSFSVDDYFSIPDNGNRLRDIELRLVTNVNKENITNSSRFVHYKELLVENAVHFIPECIANKGNYKGLRVFELQEANPKELEIFNQMEINPLEALKKLMNY